jgi:hypothetical protein
MSPGSLRVNKHPHNGFPHRIDSEYCWDPEERSLELGWPVRSGGAQPDSVETPQGRVFPVPPCQALHLEGRWSDHAQIHRIPNIAN